MEIPAQTLFIGFLIFVFICYLFYNCLCQNAELLENKKESKQESKQENKKESKQENKKESKQENMFSRIAKKGIKAVSSSNNLEEIPKFLDV